MHEDCHCNNVLQTINGVSTVIKETKISNWYSLPFSFILPSKPLKFFIFHDTSSKYFVKF